MTKVTLNKLRTFFNLAQWIIRWYNLDTQAAQMYSFNALLTSQTMKQTSPKAVAGNACVPQ